MRRAAILSVIRDVGVSAIKTADLAPRVGLSARTTLRELQALEREHLIERSHPSGHGCRWGPPGTWEHYRPVREKAALRHREPVVEELEIDDDDDFARPSVRVWVRAADAPRMTGWRINSVFNLGTTA